MVLYGGVLALIGLAFILNSASLAVTIVALAVALTAVVFIVRQLLVLKHLDGLLVNGDHLSLVLKGRPLPVRIVGNPVVTERLIALRCLPLDRAARLWRPALNVVLLPDSITPEDHHFLRTLLVGRVL